MTVAELMNKLAEMPKELTVIINDALLGDTEVTDVMLERGKLIKATIFRPSIQEPDYVRLIN